MKNFTSLFTFILLASLGTAAYANVFYRHVPFNLPMTANDTVMVDYDFAGHFGIRCSTNTNTAHINFVYKGHQKSATLPVTLQNAQVPNHSAEELADISGQFKISMLNEVASSQEFNLSCDYVEPELS